MPAVPMHEIIEQNRTAFEATAELYRRLTSGVMPNQLNEAWQRVVQCAKPLCIEPSALLYLFNSYELDDWLSGDLWKLMEEAATYPEFEQEVNDVETLVKQIEAAIADGAAVAST